MGGLAPSIPHDAVRMATGFEASILCARDAGANPPNTTAWMAPSREMASVAMSAAGIMGTRYINIELIVSVQLTYCRAKPHLPY